MFKTIDHKNFSSLSPLTLSFHKNSEFSHEELSEVSIDPDVINQSYLKQQDEKQFKKQTKLQKSFQNLNNGHVLNKGGQRKKNQENIEMHMKSEVKYAKISKKIKGETAGQLPFLHERKKVNEDTKQKVVIQKDLNQSCAQENQPEKQKDNHNDYHVNYNPRINSNHKMCKGMSVFCKEKDKRLYFKMDYLQEPIKEVQSAVFSREEIMEHDPRWVLYFYENHLEFPEYPEFRPEMLKRI